MNKGIGYYGFEHEVDLYGHAIEYDHKDVKGGYGQVSPAGAEGIVTDDLSYLINYIDGRELKEYIKILYYLCNLDPNFMEGAFRNEEQGELALEFPIKELCFSNLSKPINELMDNITKIYDSGFRVPDKYYSLSETLKDHMAHTDVMVPNNADKILEDTETTIFYRPFLYIVPFYHTHYLSYYQTIMKIEKITRNKTVLLGEDVEFEVKVSNLGNYSVYDIFVKDEDYDHDGLIFKEYRNGTGHWVYDAETGRYNLGLTSKDLEDRKALTQNQNVEFLNTLEGDTYTNRLYELRQSVDKEDLTLSMHKIQRQLPEKKLASLMVPSIYTDKTGKHFEKWMLLDEDKKTPVEYFRRYTRKNDNTKEYEEYFVSYKDLPDNPLDEELDITATEKNADKVSKTADKAYREMIESKTSYRYNPRSEEAKKDLAEEAAKAVKKKLEKDKEDRDDRD